MRPLIVGQITGVSQFAAVIAPAVLCRPHRWPSSNQATTLESQPIQGIQYVSGQTLRESADLHTGPPRTFRNRDYVEYRTEPNKTPSMINRFLLHQFSSLRF